jgi:hypothetical protein
MNDDGVCLIFLVFCSSKASHSVAPARALTVLLFTINDVDEDALAGAVTEWVGGSGVHRSCCASVLQQCFHHLLLVVARLCDWDSFAKFGALLHLDMLLVGVWLGIPFNALL